MAFLQTFTAAGITIASPVTMATWPDGPPTGISIVGDATAGSIGLAASDWGAWKIYVATSAASFGVMRLAQQRLPTNEWITLAGNDTLRFFVDGAVGLKVYICPSGAEPAGYIWSGVDEILAWDTPYGGRWRPNATKYSDLQYPLLTVNNPALYRAEGWQGWTWQIIGGTPSVGWLTVDAPENVSPESFNQVLFATGTFPSCNVVYVQSTGASPALISISPP
jgi:hypothetical protein